jgi:large subunit ribosomal protein L9
MKVILIQDIKNLGKKGDTKEVSNGYARNYLLPKNMVKVATPEATAIAEKEKEHAKKRQTENSKKLMDLADSLKGKIIFIKTKEKKGKLFGSIGPKEIRKALALENIDIQENNIIQKNPIKKVGEHKIKIELANNIEADIMLEVTGDK